MLIRVVGSVVLIVGGFVCVALVLDRPVIEYAMVGGAIAIVWSSLAVLRTRRRLR